MGPLYCRYTKYWTGLWNRIQSDYCQICCLCFIKNTMKISFCLDGHTDSNQEPGTNLWIGFKIIWIHNLDREHAQKAKLKQTIPP